MAPLTLATFFALIVGALLLYAFIKTNDPTHLILSVLGFALAIIDFVILIINLNQNG